MQIPVRKVILRQEDISQKVVGLNSGAEKICTREIFLKVHLHSGSVGRAVTSEKRDPRFESRLGQNLI